ncbi:Hypothetical predicted protein [Lecanosticta acicola]|uniref:Uncharacterized protein n=1 Tax=Lecanosticta acicola TaxID=111012 RepID=A0AAI9EE02_9PEZI|nr:Hypothetical predicted protein [Lecanosticta acicola]
MKHFACPVLLVAAAVAAPAPVTKRGEVAERAPIAEAFASTFPGFYGKSEEDVAKFITKGAQVTTETSAQAAKWTRDATEAGDEVNYAIAMSKRSLHISKRMSEDEEWVEKEYERADSLARRAARLRREAVAAAETASEGKGTAEEVRFQSFAALNAKREAETALEEVAEAYATVAYALKIRSSPQSVEFFTTRDQTAAEGAMGRERRARRESFFANQAARKREAVHEQALKLRDEF